MIINTQPSSFVAGQFVGTIYCMIVAIFVFIFSNAWYNKAIKQFLVEKELEQQTVQLKEQAEVLKLQNHLIEDQKAIIANELDISRRQITATALVLARKQNTNELLKAEVSSMDETVPLSRMAKNKFFKKLIKKPIRKMNGQTFSSNSNWLNLSFSKIS